MSVPGKKLVVEYDVSRLDSAQTAALMGRAIVLCDGTPPAPAIGYLADTVRGSQMRAWAADIEDVLLRTVGDHWLPTHEDFETLQRVVDDLLVHAHGLEEAGQ